MIDTPEFICSHRRIENGEVLYQVKWVGYDCEDTTWEPEDVVQEEWPELLQAYLDDIKRNAPSKMYDFKSSQQEQSDALFEYLESIEDWEEAVDEIVYMEKCKVPGYLVYVKWKDGTRSVHHSSQINERCPQKMIDFYEKHLVKAPLSKQ
ncbi:hypothetical protein RMATCC62417_03042 [Rhizopus microsporus]|nr:hypothetical protein RMATCC62417_03042 [Rhizopus microsporus]CEI87662.1 hypothetical protein RMCBS344292_02072 [Rhizopus microsporus]